MIESFEWTEGLEQLNQAFRAEWDAKRKGEAEPILKITIAGMILSMNRPLELLAAKVEIERLREQLRQAEERREAEIDLRCRIARKLEITGERVAELEAALRQIRAARPRGASRDVWEIADRMLRTEEEARGG